SSVRECLRSAPWEKSSSGQTCVEVREMALLRHIREMRSVKPKHWSLEWFEVSNPSLAEMERPRGIHLVAEGKDRVQERYILVNARGAHQTVILDRTHSPRGELARMMLEQAIRSQRVFSDLSGSRAWVDR